MSRCCMCGGLSVLKYCAFCKHVFCGDCRTKPFYRTKAALLEWFRDQPPRYCNHA